MRLKFVPAGVVLPVLLSAVGAAGVLAGCGALGLKSDKIDYRAVERSKPLDVPPELTPLPQNDRFAVPGQVGAPGAPDPAGTPAAAAAASVVQSGSARTAAGGPAVAPGSPNARIERAGAQRWLAVDVSPEQAFQVVKEFWPSVGLAVERDDPAAGIVETAWAQNRAKLPQDALRRAIGRVFDGFYSTGEQDKFRTRVERTPKNTAEIFITHRGMIEVYSNPSQDNTRWQPRPPDTELEAEMLQRLALRFTPAAEAAGAKPAAEAAAKAAVAAAPQPAQNVRLVKTAQGKLSKLEIDEPFDRAWRRIGLGLDRGGFTVEDRDRAKGLYFVRFLDPEYDAKQRERQGLFSKLFGRDFKVDPQRFRVLVSAGDQTTGVTVLDKEGGPEAGPTGEKILTLLSEQLR